MSQQEQKRKEAAATSAAEKAGPPSIPEASARLRNAIETIFSSADKREKKAYEAHGALWADAMLPPPLSPPLSPPTTLANNKRLERQFKKAFAKRDLVKMERLFAKGVHPFYEMHKMFSEAAEAEEVSTMKLLIRNGYRPSAYNLLKVLKHDVTHPGNTLDMLLREGVQPEAKTVRAALYRTEMTCSLEEARAIARKMLLYVRKPDGKMLDIAIKDFPNDTFLAETLIRRGAVPLQETLDTIAGDDWKTQAQAVVEHNKKCSDAPAPVISATAAGIYQPGDAVEGEGIYTGQYTITDSAGLSRTFNVFAAPQDLPGLGSYEDAVEQISKLKCWYGHNGAGYKTDGNFFNALRTGRYTGEWIIPPSEIACGISPDEDSNEKVTLADNLLAATNKGAFKATFKMAVPQVDYESPDWYWSSTPCTPYDWPYMRGTHPSTNTSAWLSKSSPSSCRPVRLVEVKGP